MKVVRTAIEEFIGLFVEDGTLAVGILVWLAVAAFVFPLISGFNQYRAPVLFLGLVALLVENVMRSARL